MAGLSVVLETTHKNHPGKKPPAQIISKATLLIHGPKQKHVSPPPPASSFLQRCCLCHRELAEGRDIYMYRGDRAFCSEECRRQQIFMDEDAGSSCCANGAGAATARGSRRVAGGGGSVAY
ncbi:hypothetical protein SEVIR_1G219600v4 [Setaria viridis]|uniref:FLZ-type domain-containing protein n=2 Tax=Setaria TaxID=4554 RepID=K3Z0M8_SETIT|nr:uncharacterized protein LOC101764776 [Setaria italica]XP_034571899.1 FCS-Like Zinc finger 6-like [Setaria viridis]RCV07085.1 hypothetical protein SETIT_1G215900v2 [Setaria italica]TKW40041.1 hypothetical protein SEVIR_1G219600v2 [Setaria viridis]